MQARWDENSQGIHYGFSGLHVTTESVAKFGQLYLQKGLWQGKCLLSEKWINTATREHISSTLPGGDKAVDWEQGYGYQFWMCQHGAYRGDGAFGQFCVVMPEQDAVLAVTSAVQNMQDVLDLAWTHLLPALGTQPLEESSHERHALETQLANLTLAPVNAEVTSSIPKTVSGKTYYFETHQLDNRSELATPNFEEAIQSVTLHFHDDECQIVITDAKKEHHLNCGYQQWLGGETTFYGNSKVETSGAWTNPSTFTTKIIYIETPHCLTVSCHFDGDKLTLKRTWNISFGPLELPDLIGHTH
jgi:hypothetical protein